MHSTLEGVTIVITQSGVQVGDTLYTDAEGNAFTTLPYGYYTATFSYPNRTTISTNFRITKETYMIFVYPESIDSTTSEITEGIYVSTSNNLFVWDGDESWLTRSLNPYPIYHLEYFDTALWGIATNGYLYEYNGTDSWLLRATLGKTPAGLLTFGDYLYTVSSDGTLYQYDNEGAFTSVTSTLNYQPQGLAIYNNELYTVTWHYTVGGKFYKWNGTDDWTLLTTAADFTNPLGNLTVYNSKIYTTSGTNTPGYLFEFNPAGSYTKYAFPYGYQPGKSIVFNDSLYVVVAGYSQLYVWGGDTTWTLKAYRAGSSLDVRLTEYNNKLYAATDDGELLEWDGISLWILKASGIATIYDALLVET